ncbi:MAG: D-alanyl-D-alanine carboxypeptidase [Defluviitaleaceae bacterium]|nr:D-alanyl-D-alanine carboxypeptidase [Defluviitaleaceae bacterium]
MKNFAFLLAFFASVAATQDIKPPSVDAAGAVLIDMDSGRVLWEKDKDKELAMASTTKIMTAILAIEQGNLDDVVVVSKRAAAAPKVNMSLQAGEEIPLKALLYAIMLQSSNDAAVAIAEHISGDVEVFCKMMTTKAHALGATNTYFATPSGLDGDMHHSTAHDMAIIAQYALQNPTFVSIINTPSYHATSNKRSHDISNKNRLLNEYDGAFGVKTGFTNKAGHCFVGAAERGDLNLISVVFASGWGAKGKERKWIDTKNLLNYGFDNFEMVEVIGEGQPAGHIAVVRSRTPQLDLAYSHTLTLPLIKSSEDVKITPQIPTQIQAPINADTQIGYAQIHINGQHFADVPIHTTTPATRHDLKTSLEKVLKTFFSLGADEEITITLPEF